MYDFKAITLPPRWPGADVRRRLGRGRVWWTILAILLAITALDPAQGRESAAFAARSLLETAPYLIVSIVLAAWAGASGADGIIARLFTGSPILMIGLAAAFGGLSPFCSCGVIPLIAALLAMGVPLSAVMAFWLASPVIDPSMFVLTVGVLGLEFALAKTLAAVGLGLFGGCVTLLLSRSGALDDPLREGAGGGCGGPAAGERRPIVWAFWHDPARRQRFGREARRSALFLAQWLALAFVLESLMIAFVPAAWVAQAVGSGGFVSILIATLVGVPAYLNGYAALPLVSGLVEQGMAPGAGLAFLVAGGVTSLPAAIAVWALARRRVFALYVGLALCGSLVAGALFQGFVG